MEDDNLKALAKYSDMENEEWLHKFFDLYKSILLWPPGLPPTKWPRIIKDTLTAKFHSYYGEALSEFNHKLDNDNHTLEKFQIINLQHLQSIASPEI